jgi:hypothetical protein
LLALLDRAGRANKKDYGRDLINSQVVPSYSQVDLPGVRLYRRMMDRHKPAIPEGADRAYAPLPYSFTSLEGFLGARLLVALLEKHGKAPSRARLPRTVEDLGDVDLGLGKRVGFSQGGRRDGPGVYFTVVAKGQFVPVADWKKWQR